jgi:hypothetical protein
MENVLNSIEEKYLINADLKAFISNVPDFQQIQRTYKITGFLQDYVWMDMNTILEAVKNTQFYDTPNANDELCIAVGCYGFPHNIVSVWIFAAVLRQKEI